MLSNHLNLCCLLYLLPSIFPVSWLFADCSLPGFSVHGILQVRVLEWVAIPFSRGSSWSRDWTQVSCIAGGFVMNLSHWGSPVCNGKESKKSICITESFWYTPETLLTNYASMKKINSDLLKLVKGMSKQFTDKCKLIEVRWSAVSWMRLFIGMGTVSSLLLDCNILLDQEGSVWGNCAFLTEGKEATISLPPERSWSTERYPINPKLEFWETSQLHPISLMLPHAPLDFGLGISLLAREAFPALRGLAWSVHLKDTSAS